MTFRSIEAAKMRKLFNCDVCGCTVSTERDLDEKEDGTKICPNCGSTSIDVYGFLYELESYNPYVKHIGLENGGVKIYKTSEYLAHIKEVTK